MKKIWSRDQKDLDQILVQVKKIWNKWKRSGPRTKSIRCGPSKEQRWLTLDVGFLVWGVARLTMCQQAISGISFIWTIWIRILWKKRKKIDWIVDLEYEATVTKRILNFLANFGLPQVHKSTRPVSWWPTSFIQFLDTIASSPTCQVGLENAICKILWRMKYSSRLHPSSYFAIEGRWSPEDYIFKLNVNLLFCPPFLEYLFCPFDGDHGFFSCQSSWVPKVYVTSKLSCVFQIRAHVNGPIRCSETFWDLTYDYSYDVDVSFPTWWRVTPWCDVLPS